MWFILSHHKSDAVLAAKQLHEELNINPFKENRDWCWLDPRDARMKLAGQKEVRVAMVKRKRPHMTNERMNQDWVIALHEVERRGVSANLFITRNVWI